MSQAQIEKKVETYLRNAQLLAHYWRQPLTPEQLQAEMERMARELSFGEGNARDGNRSDQAANNGSES